MRAGPAQDQITSLLLVDQDPVRFHMAISPTLPFALQAMVSVLRLQGTTVAQRFDDRAKLGHILAALLLRSTSCWNLVVGFASRGGGGAVGSWGLLQLRLATSDTQVLEHRFQARVVDQVLAGIGITQDLGGFLVEGSILFRGAFLPGLDTDSALATAAGPFETNSSGSPFFEEDLLRPAPRLPMSWESPCSSPWIVSLPRHRGKRGLAADSILPISYGALNRRILVSLPASRGPPDGRSAAAHPARARSVTRIRAGPPEAVDAPSGL